jgi:small-conductance mechanosensitive channel
MPEPEPFVIFVGYGASSIDFELRCWIQSFAEGLRIQTDLYLDIWDRLKAAGVEIPFPQQDLHVRSVDPAAAAALSGRPGPTPSAPLPPAPPPAEAPSPRPAAKPDREDPIASDDAGGEGSEPP